MNDAIAFGTDDSKLSGTDMNFIEYIEIGCGVAVIAFALFIAFTLGWIKKG